MSEQTIYNLLRSYTQYIFFNYSSNANIAGWNAFEQLINKIDQGGTNSVYVTDLKAFTSKSCFFFVFVFF